MVPPDPVPSPILKALEGIRAILTQRATPPFNQKQEYYPSAFFFQVEVLNSHNHGHPQSQTEVCSPRARLDASLDHKEPMGSRKEPKWSGHPGKLGGSGHVSFTKQYRKIQFFYFVFK